MYTFVDGSYDPIPDALKNGTRSVLRVTHSYHLRQQILSAVLPSLVVI